MAKDTSSFADEVLPEIIVACELSFAFDCVRLWAETPHCCGKDDASKALLTTYLAEHAQVLQAGAADSNVGDSMQIDNASKPYLELVGLSQPVCDLSENIRVRLVRNIEPWSIDQEDLLSIGHDAGYHVDFIGACFN